MQSSKLGYQKWAIAIYLVATNLKGISSMRLHRELKVRQPTAWHLAQRIREGFVAGQVLMSGQVEVDETFIGGKERNKHPHKKLNAGRGTVGKAVVVGAKNRETKKVSATVVKSTDQENPARVHPGPGYRRLNRLYRRSQRLRWPSGGF